MDKLRTQRLRAHHGGVLGRAGKHRREVDQPPTNVEALHPQDRGAAIASRRHGARGSPMQFVPSISSS